MSQSDKARSVGAGRTRFILLVVILLGILLFILTYIGIQKSRSDSLELLRQQGVALIESLTLSADNAIKANSFFDLLVQAKFSDLAGFLEANNGLVFSRPELSDFASAYGVDAILIYDNKLNLKSSGAANGFTDLGRIHRLILPEVEALLGDSSAGFSFQINEGDFPGDVSLYYLSKSTDNNYVVAIVSDALFYTNAKKDIGIGYLVQNIAREVGVEYILFQTTEAIVFSSRKIGPILKIEKDPFLTKALEADTVLSREYVLNGRKIMELVNRFSSDEYGEGLFRIGVSLDKYYDIIAGYNRQMIILSIVIFAVFVFAVLYLTGRQKRTYLDRSFKQMKSLSEKVFDSINAGLVAIDNDGTIQMANRQFLDIFGIRQEDIIGTEWNLYPCRGIIPFEETLSGSAVPEEIESTLEIPDGKKHLLVNTSRLYDFKNRLTGVVAVVYDYTAVKELEAVARRKERLTELGDLAAGVAHEIRNPLNAISIAAQRLMSEQESAEESQSFARQIKSEANRLNDIVTRFLFMARGKGNTEKKKDIGKIIEGIIELLKLDPESAGIEIKSEIGRDVFAAVSEDRIKQMVINLVRNGIEACPVKGGIVTVRLKADDNRARLSVADNGQGIPENIKEKIFAPYFTTKDKGTGLGLSIVHQIVEELKGEIAVESSHDAGTEIKINFPI